MASSFSTFSTIFSLALVFVFIAPLSARHHRHHRHDHNPLIDELCSNTTNRSLCVTSLGSDWRSQTADEQGLIEIAIDSAFNKATTIHMDLNKLYDETKDFSLKEKYHSASKNYNDAIRDLQTTKKHLREKDYDHIVVQVMDAAQELKDVRETLNDWRVSTELKNGNRELEVLVDVIRVFTDHTVEKH